VGEAARLITAAGKELVRLKKVEKHVSAMFDDGVLDPYPASDDADEYHLRRLTRWRWKRRADRS
jgi:hypothetical protein